MERAFRPYRQQAGVRCAFCGTVGDDIAPAHLFGAGAFPQLREIEENILPLCFSCHRWYDSASIEARRLAVERVVPGRWLFLSKNLEKTLDF